MKNAKELARQIIIAVGGNDNIGAVAHCMTRLRLTINDNQQVNQSTLKSLEGVLGIIDGENQLQIVLGPGFVNKVATEVNILTGTALDEVKEEKDLKAAIREKNRTPFKLFLRKLANIFVPLIPAIVGSGMIAGLTNIAIQNGLDPKSSLVTILNVMGWGIFSYLGIFVGINAAKEFGGTPALGGLAGVLILNPAIATIQINQTTLVPGRGGLIGILLVAFFMSITEKRIRKFVPNAVDIIVTPTITLLLTGFVTYYLLQPIGGFLSDQIVTFFKTALQSGGVIAGFILAGAFLPIVMTGLHQGLVPIHMELLNTLKENPLLPILAMAGAGQVGAAMAVYLKTNNRKLKEIIKGALPVGFLGIGEPLIFGVTLPLGRPFITACIGSAFGGAVQANLHVSSVAIGVSGLPLTFLIKPGSVFYYLIGLFTAYAAGFFVTWLIGFDDPVNEGL
ncbi:MAG: PTS transporter subunit EIIC [Pelosinus sp.]|nr:PTS transporter subunit EIIC [Pelosinus sp.]